MKRTNLHGKDRWEPRNHQQLSKQLSSDFGFPIHLSSKRGGLKAIANALNEGNVVRAQIATVLLAIPDPPPRSKGVGSRSDVIKFIRDLHWSGIIKWDPDEHPRWPAGAADNQGGQFAPKGEEDASFNRTRTARRRWMRTNNRDWPIDEKTGRPQDVAHIRARADGGSDEPNNIRPMPHDEHVQEHKQRGDFSRWAQRRGKGDAARATSTLEAEQKPQTAQRSTPKSPRAITPRVGAEPTPEPAPAPEEPIVPDELLLEELPFIVPE